MAVTFSIGHLEGWITKAASTGLAFGDETLAHLRIVEDAYKELRRGALLYKNYMREIKSKVDIANSIIGGI